MSAQLTNGFKFFTLDCVALPRHMLYRTLIQVVVLLFSAAEPFVFLRRSHIKSVPHLSEREVHCLIAAVLLRTGLNDVFDDSKRVLLKYFLSFSFLSCHVSPLVSFILICFFYHTSSACLPPSHHSPSDRSIRHYRCHKCGVCVCACLYACHLAPGCLPLM